MITTKWLLNGFKAQRTIASKTNLINKHFLNIEKQNLNTTRLSISNSDLKNGNQTRNLVQIIPDRPPRNRKPEKKKIILDAEETISSSSPTNEKPTIMSRIANGFLFFQGLFYFVILFMFVYDC